MAKCRGVVATGRGGGVSRGSPPKIGCQINVQKSLFLSENFGPKLQNLRLETPIRGKLKL